MTRKYRAENINGVFVARRKDNWLLGLLAPEFRFLNFKRGKVAFNSGKTVWGQVNTYRFGSILDEDEAQQIVSEIHQRFPHYKYRSKARRANNGMHRTRGVARAGDSPR